MIDRKAYLRGLKLVAFWYGGYSVSPLYKLWVVYQPSVRLKCVDESAAASGEAYHVEGPRITIMLGLYIFCAVCLLGLSSDGLKQLSKIVDGFEKSYNYFLLGATVFCSALTLLLTSIYDFKFQAVAEGVFNQTNMTLPECEATLTAPLFIQAMKNMRSMETLSLFTNMVMLMLILAHTSCQSRISAKEQQPLLEDGNVAAEKSDAEASSVSRLGVK